MSDKDDVNEMISDAIDDLNARGDFSGTNIEQAPKTKSQKRGLLEDRPLLTLLTVLAIASATTLAALTLTKEKVITHGEAAKQLEDAISSSKTDEGAKKTARELARTLAKNPPASSEEVWQALEEIEQNAQAAGLNASALGRIESIDKTPDGGFEFQFSE